MFGDSRHPLGPHIDLAAADLLCVAPATANFLAKAAHGLAGDLLGTGLRVGSPATSDGGPNSWLIPFVSQADAAGLDPVLRADLWQSFRELTDGGATLLVSSHSMEEASECDDLLLMREGAILAATTPDGLRERTGENDLSRAFLAIIRGSGQ